MQITEMEEEPPIVDVSKTPADLIHKKRIVIGLPGSHFSNNFLLSWSQTLNALFRSDRYEVIIANGVSSFVSFARMKTMGLDVLRGPDQKPFNGLEYDVYLTLDSDIVFSPAQIIQIIEATEQHPVVAGHYMMSDAQHFATVREWDTEFFTRNGYFQFMTPTDLALWKGEQQAKGEQDRFLEVSYIGMGFFACRKEVMDSLKYPYFNAELQRIRTADGREIIDLCSEDVAFCKNIQRAGYKIMMDTTLRVGHEKRVVL